MTAIFAVHFDWSIESCDIAPRDLNYERNTEKYGRAMKLTIGPLDMNKYARFDEIPSMTKRYGRTT